MLDERVQMLYTPIDKCIFHALGASEGMPNREAGANPAQDRYCKRCSLIYQGNNPL